MAFAYRGDSIDPAWLLGRDLRVDHKTARCEVEGALLRAGPESFRFDTKGADGGGPAKTVDWLKANALLAGSRIIS